MRHAWLATIIDPDASAQEEAAVLKTVTNTYPTITSVRVKDALDIVNTLLGQLATAVRAVAAVALVASILVLAGALAAGNRARIHDIDGDNPVFCGDRTRGGRLSPQAFGRLRHGTLGSIAEGVLPR